MPSTAESDSEALPPGLSPSASDTEAEVLLDELNRILAESGDSPPTNPTSYWRRRFRVVRQRLSFHERKVLELDGRLNEAHGKLAAETAARERTDGLNRTLQIEATQWKQVAESTAAVLADLKSSRAWKIANWASGVARRVRRPFSGSPS